MEEDSSALIELLAGSIGSTITAVQETDGAVILHLNDHQRVVISIIEDGGFTIDLQARQLH